MSNPDFERQLGALLRDTAGDIESQAEVASRVRKRLAADGGGLGSRQWLAAASMVAIVALIVGTFAWFKSGQLGSHPVDSSQIVFHLDAAYADATTTTLEYHVTAPRKNVLYNPGFPVLTSASGTSLPMGDGCESHPNRVTICPSPNGTQSLACAPTVSAASQCMQFAPLPADELGTRQMLTLTFTQMDEIPLQLSGNPPSPAPSLITGSWRASIEVTPVAGTSQTLHDAPQTHGGISIQPEQLDASPRGVRIVLRIGGLTPGSQESPIFLSSANSTNEGGDTSVDTSAGRATLVPATGTPLYPAKGFRLGSAGNPLFGPSPIPASGMLDIELIYLQPLSGPVTLRVDSISLSTGASSVRTITGPWIFPLTIPT